MTELLIQNERDRGSANDKYFDTDELVKTLETIDVQDMITEFTDTNTITINSNDFAQKNPDLIIDGYKDPENIEIKVTEYAPKVFRSIRQQILSESKL